MEDFEVIQNYKKMRSIKKICEDANVNYKCLLQNRVNAEHKKIVAQNCKAEIIKMNTKIVLGG